jgi:hypothetical protein
MNGQHEITTAGPLLGPDGRLMQRGYSRSHLLDYNPEFAGPCRSAILNRLRLKEWDYYGVTGSDWFFSVAVADIGYMGMVFAYLIDFRRGTFMERTMVTPPGRGVRLPLTTVTGDVCFEGGDVKAIFRREPQSRSIELEWKRFDGGRDLCARLTLEQPEGRDSIVMATPIRDRCFYYNEKVPAMPAFGRVSLGDTAITFERDCTFAVLDWGRGVWEYKTMWNWASAQGRLEGGEVFGLNLGQGFGDLSAATENCFFVDGTLHKLGAVKWSYGSGDWMAPWRFEADDGRLSLTMKPMVDRPASVNLVVLKSSVHQVFGRYYGRCVCDGGKVLEVNGITGWAEEHMACW